MKFFLIHGAYGSPNENWFLWLRAELEKQGHKVIIPKFPTPQNQNLDSWMEVFEPYLDELGPDTVLVAHSLGPAFALSVLEAINTPVKACFFVAGFLGKLGNKKFDALNASFVLQEFDWTKIKENGSSFFLYGSDNDPYVPLKLEEDFASLLDSDLYIVPGAGHFNTDSGYNEFPRLLEDIQKLN